MPTRLLASGTIRRRRPNSGMPRSGMPGGPGPALSVAVVGGGIGTLFVVGLILVRWPQVRALGSLQDVKPAHAAPVAEV